MSVAQTTDLGEIIARQWESAPALEVPGHHPDQFVDGETVWRKVSETILKNPFHYDFSRQLLSLDLPMGAEAATLRVAVEPCGDAPFQIVDGRIACLAALPACSTGAIALYQSSVARTAQPVNADEPRLAEESAAVWRLEAGGAAFRIPGPAAEAGLAPILSVRGADGIWRGQGRFVLPEGVEILARTVHILESGPLLLRIALDYTLPGDRHYALTLTAVAGDACLLVHERSEEIAGAAFEFSLREFSGGRGFLHWYPEGRGTHWTSLKKEDREAARLQESVAWWVNPQGFAYAMTPDSLEERDYVGVFTLRRGEWIDRKFERIAQGPIDEKGKENRELDWPFPEMVGSSVSMITAHTTAEGDAFFRFRFFDGERQWGLLASSLEKNDGTLKEISRVQHKYSSPRLQDFKDWNLDAPDVHPRPHALVQAGELPALRRKRGNPHFAGIWAKICAGNVHGCTQGLAFAVKGDPAIAWRKRIELLAVAGVYSKLTLLGRDHGDLYSPVGGRPITQWAEDYDLIAASGVFSPEEERLMRAFFLLMGHMYMEEDFMNWRFNARNANFEADRTDIVGTMGLVFEGNPAARKFLDHVVERTCKALVVYCTPGSGKWYENPGCYYLQASKCRVNLLYHLARHGYLNLEQIPRLKDFLRWGILLLTPPLPTSYDVLCRGDAASYDAAEKVRKLPPIGDHGAVGRWVPEHYALMGKLFAKSDPAFGAQLLNAYFCGSGDGARMLSLAPDGPQKGECPDFLLGNFPFWRSSDGSNFGNLPLLFAALEESDLPVASPALELQSRRLEGFGSIFRSGVNTEKEFYLLAKQGPGGYRFHRTEGSFLLFAQGKPLVFDGGEAGETWRHSTLSFYETHMPLAAGHVERFFAHPAFQFSQGVHPEVIAPGQPVFLSDVCHHDLVEVCHRRFRQDPAVVRSFAWVAEEYLVIHDDLRLSGPIPSHWHLQVVSDAAEGNAAAGFRFRGRFGVDLAVWLPGQRFDAEKMERLATVENSGAPEDWFAMQHLQLDGGDASGYLAILQPLSADEPAQLQAAPLRQGGRMVGVTVETLKGQDWLWFAREKCQWEEGAVCFAGRYGAYLERKGNRRLILMDAGKIKASEVVLVSTGPKVVLEETPEGWLLTVEGEGSVEGRVAGKPFHYHVQEALCVQLGG